MFACAREQRAKPTAGTFHLPRAAHADEFCSPGALISLASEIFRWRMPVLNLGA